MVPQVKTLAESVRLCYLQTDEFKTGNIQVLMALPLDENAAANALLLYLLKRSCKIYPDFSCLNGKLSELYGATLSASVAKLGEAQVLKLGIDFIDDRFTLSGERISDECARLLAGMIFEPNCKNGSFGQQALASEKRFMCSRIQDEINDKRTYAYNRCVGYMCAEEAFGIDRLGTEEKVNAVTMKALYEAWKRLLKTAVFQINVVGNVPCDEIEKIFTEKLAKIDREPVKAETVFLLKAKRFFRHEESFPVNQGKLVMGFRAGVRSCDENRYALTVMNDIFGGGTYSKLFANVREKLSLAYYCWSRYIRRKGLVIVECGIDTDKEKKVSAEILCQLSDIRNGKIADEVIEASKLSFREKYNLNTPHDISAWYAEHMLDDELETPEQVLEGIEQVTKEQICEVAKKVTLDTIYMLSATQESSEEGESDEN